MKNLTAMEQHCLQCIVDNEYQDGAGEDVIDNPIWYMQASDVDSKIIKVEQLSGVMSSLSKKGYVGIQKEGRDSTCWITKSGYDALMEWNTERDAYDELVAESILELIQYES
jgi:hypothetical protein